MNDLMVVVVGDGYFFYFWGGRNGSLQMILLF